MKRFATRSGWGLLALLLAFGGSAPAARATAPRPASPDAVAAELGAVLASEAGHDLATRIELASAHFLGRPYVLGPLGEGAGGRFDAKPLYRADAFDCTTYVETVAGLALAAPRDFAGFTDALRRIRYVRGRIAYETRNHFPETEWIPNNIAAGFFRDATLELAGNSPAAHAEAIIDMGAWFRHRTDADIQVPGLSAAERASRLTELHAFGNAFEPQRASLPYVPIAAIPEVAPRIPSGTFLNVVRENWNPPGQFTPLLVSHQGIVIRKADGVYIRHASLDLGKVVDLPLVQYLLKYANSATVRGVNLLEPRE